MQKLSHGIVSFLAYFNILVLGKLCISLVKKRFEEFTSGFLNESKQFFREAATISSYDTVSGKTWRL